MSPVLLLSIFAAFVELELAETRLCALFAENGYMDAVPVLEEVYLHTNRVFSVLHAKPQLQVILHPVTVSTS